MRSKWEIYREILMNCKEGMQKSRLTQRVNVNFNELNQYLAELQEHGLIVAFNRAKKPRNWGFMSWKLEKYQRVSYVTTVKGLEYVRYVTRLLLFWERTACRTGRLEIAS